MLKRFLSLLMTAALLMCLLPAAVAEEGYLPAKSLLDGNLIQYNDRVVRTGIKESLYGKGDVNDKKDVAKYAKYVGIGLTPGNRELKNHNESGYVYAAYGALSDMDHAPAKGTVDLSCLQFCSNLRELAINCESVTGLEVLTKLPKLETLHIRTVEPIDLSVLEKCKKLNTVSFVQCEGYDYAPLQKLKKLNALCFTDCKDVDLSFLAEKVKLKSLYVSGGSVKNFEAAAAQKSMIMLCVLNTPVDAQALNNVIASCKKLLQLSLWKMDVAPLDAIFAAKTLEGLDLAQCQNVPTEAEAWKALSKLNSLDLSECGLTDCAFIETLKKVDFLSLRGNKLTDITPLGARKKYRTLNLSGNSIQDLSPITSCKFEYILDVSGNPLTYSADVMEALQNNASSFYK